MALGRINLGGGSNKVVNGIIEQYLAETETIEANTFVEFVKKQYTKDIDTTLLSENSDMRYFSVALLNNNKIFISYHLSNNLYGAICTFNGDTVVKGTSVLLISGSSSSWNESLVVALDENTIFILNNRSYYSGMICTINGDLIDVGTNTVLYNKKNWEIRDSNILLKLNQNKVFFIHPSDSTNWYLNGMVCTISGNLISVVIDKTISTSKGSQANSSACVINEDKVFIAHQGNDTYRTLKAEIVNINATSIISYSKELLGSYNGYCISVSKFDENKIFITYEPSNGDYLNGAVCTIEGNSITMGISTNLISKERVYVNVQTFTLNKNKVFVTHRTDSTDKYLNATVCMINNEEISVGEDINLITTSNEPSGTARCGLELSNEKVLFVYKWTSTELKIMITNGNISNIFKISNNKIDGITKSKATTTSPGEVWVLKDNETN